MASFKEMLEASTGSSWWAERWQSSPHIYTVDNSTPKVPVYLNEPEGVYVPPVDGMANDDYKGLAGAHQLAFNFMQGVPVLDSFEAGKPADWLMVIHNTETNELWEWWHMWKDTIDGAVPAPGGPYDRWIPRWGGYINDVTTHSGQYNNRSGSDWRHREYQSWGAPATSLSAVGGLPLEAEMEAGVIPHALNVLLPLGQGYVWPAWRYDNWGGIIPEGTRFRLKPSFDVESIRFPTAQGQRTARMFATAAQTYGIINNDHAPGVVMRTEWPQSETNYYDNGGRSGRQNEDWPDILSAAFPLDQMEVVDSTWRPPNGGFND